MLTYWDVAKNLSTFDLSVTTCNLQVREKKLCNVKKTQTYNFFHIYLFQFLFCYTLNFILDSSHVWLNYRQLNKLQKKIAYCDLLHFSFGSMYPRYVFSIPYLHAWNCCNIQHLATMSSELFQEWPDHRAHMTS